MSLFRRELTATQLVNLQTEARLPRRQGGPRVTAESALKHSAVWACRRLRADLVSTLPLDVYRRADGVDAEVTPPPVLVSPDGRCGLTEWLYSSQDDLDAEGNTVGIITERDSNNRPARIELVPFCDVTIRGKGSQITEYRIGGTTYQPHQVWHEKQHTRSGLPVGLSPVAYAAMGIGGYLSAQEFARDWFAGGGIPSGKLRNVAKVLKPQEAALVKARFRDTVGTGDVFVTGMDWEYEPIQAKANESSFLEQMRFSVADVCRWLGVPADMIDADESSGSITYANITQRNLQLLIMNLGPALRRREEDFTRLLLPAPRFAKFNRGALLAMDLKTRYEAHQIGINARFLAPSEVRALENRPPFTPAELAEFDKLPAPSAGKKEE